VQLLRKVLNISAERYLKNAGDLFIFHNDLSGALSQVEKALDLDPADTRALVLYGDILFCLNRDIEALAALNKALEINPEIPEANISRANVLEAMGYYHEALKNCRAAQGYLTESKDYLLPSLYDQHVSILIRLKRFRQAMSLIETVSSRLSPEEADSIIFSYHTILSQQLAKRQGRQKKLEAPILKLIS
jgi:tetratricopeptide (TPR) repeat protein